MEPVSLIVGALAAGAAKGVGETATQAVKDAYAKLKQAVAARFAGHPQAEQALQGHAEDPDTYDKPLAKQLQVTGVDQDDDVVALAQEVMRLLDAQGHASGSYTVSVHDSQGFQIGSGNTQTNTFG